MDFRERQAQGSMPVPAEQTGQMLAGRASMARLLGAITIGTEQRILTPDKPAARVLFPIPVRGYPLPSSGSTTAWLEGRADNQDDERIPFAVKPAGELLHIIRRKTR